MQYKLENQGVRRFPVPDETQRSDYLQKRKSSPSSQATRAHLEAELERHRQLLKDQPKRLERLEKVAAQIRPFFKQTDESAGE